MPIARVTMGTELSGDDLGVVLEGLFGPVGTKRHDDGTVTRMYEFAPSAEGVAPHLVRLGMTLALPMEDTRRALESVARAFEPVVAWATWLADEEVPLFTPPATERRRRYVARERRRRDEALRQMVAYQARLAARANATTR